MTNPLPIGWLGPLISVLIALGGVATAWTTLAVDNADTKRRVVVLEQRQEEDRKLIREDQKELKRDVKDINDAVQTVIRKLNVIEAAQHLERRERR